jgi:hypothetical protein
MRYPAEVEVTDQILAELGQPPLPARSQRRKTRRFLKGPIPLSWLLKTDVAAHTTTLALIIKALVDTTRDEPVSVPQEIWRQWDWEERPEDGLSML